MRVVRLVFGLGGVLIAFSGACSVVNAPEDPMAEGGADPTTSVGGGATSATTTTTSGSGGSMAECSGAGDCSHLDGECVQGLCEGGSCVTSPLPSGAACGDDTVTACSAVDTCDGMGTCLTNDEADGTACDEDLCTEMQTCTAGQCGDGTPKDCSMLDAGCMKGVCNPMDGQCGTQMETMCIDNDGCCPMGCTETMDIDCAKEEYTHSFTNGSLPSSSIQCTDWMAFQGQLTGSFSAVTLSGSNDTIGVTCNDPVKATQLCNALNTQTELNGVSCNGRVWNVGVCGGMEINSRTSTGDCTCDTAYVVRPCINNSNWGGINTTTCSAPSQSMTVICQR